MLPIQTSNDKQTPSTTNDVLLSVENLNRVLNNITVADFSEDFEFGREEKEIDLVDEIGIFIVYTVEADFARAVSGTGFTAWHTLQARVNVYDMLVYVDEEEVELNPEQKDRIIDQIKNSVQH